MQQRPRRHSLFALLLVLIGSITFAQTPPDSTADTSSTATPADAASPAPESSEPQDAPPDTPADTPAAAEPDQPRAALLEPRFAMEQLAVDAQDAEAIWLTSGEYRFLSLFRDDRSGNPRGGVLILPAAQQPAHLPVRLAALAEQLPEHGWVTLALSLPLNRPHSLPERVWSPELPLQQPSPLASTGSDEPATEPATPAEPEQPAAAEPTSPESEPEPEPEPIPASDAQPTPEIDTREAMAEITPPNALNWIAQGIGELQRHNLYNLALIAQRQGAPMATAFAAAQPPPPARPPRRGQQPIPTLRALVLIDAPADAELLEHLAKLKPLKIKVLDLITQPADRAAQERAATARRHQIDYLQVQIPAPAANLDGQEDRLVKRVRSWLQRHVSGHQIGANVVRSE